MACSFIYVDGVLNLVLGGKVVQVTKEHPSYAIVKKNLATATEAEINDLLDKNLAIKKFVEKDSDGQAKVVNNVVYFNNIEIHNTLATRIIEFMHEGLPFKHLLKFMENMAENPSYQSQKELYDFLEHKGLPITEDGCFLAYKAIKSNWTDKHTGKIDNSIGKVVKEKRQNVDDDRTKDCSKGLHCGALDYVYGYGQGDDRIVIVKVNPRDAVSVPTDASFQKLRCCEYEVICEFTGKLNAPLYTKQADEVPSPLNDKTYDWDWCDNKQDLGIKPNGQHYYNKRKNGRFTK